MRRLFLFAGLAILLGGGVALAAWPHDPVPDSAAGFSGDEVLMAAFARVHTGMPASQLAAVGFDTAKAERLSRLALIEQFMPKDSKEFDALDPAVKACYVGPADCNAFIFTAAGAQALLLVQGGRVSWKTLGGVMVA